MAYLVLGPHLVEPRLGVEFHEVDVQFTVEPVAETLFDLVITPHYVGQHYWRHAHLALFPLLMVHMLVLLVVVVLGILGILLLQLFYDGLEVLLEFSLSLALLFISLVIRVGGHVIGKDLLLEHLYLPLQVLYLGGVLESLVSDRQVVPPLFQNQHVLI